MSKSASKKKKSLNNERVFPVKNTVIAVCVFLVVFGGLLALATFNDLQVSQFLTQFSLPKGQYYANDVFGRVMETVGSAPIYLMLGFAFHILFWNVVYRIKDNVVKYILAAVATGAGVAAYYIMFKDASRYILCQIGDENFIGAGFINGAMLFFGCLLCFFATLAVKNIKEENLRKMLMFAIAVIVMAAVANGLVNLIKIPIGRMRYRAMNTESAKMIGAFDNYTPWYVFNGQRFMDQDMMWYFGTTDACKSFPSGHTCAAGMSYALIMLIDVFNIKDRKKKILLWVCPVVYTGIVAVSRIMVGAHFFSDVLVGGTFAFVTMLLVREIFILKGAHFKKTR